MKNLQLNFIILIFKLRPLIRNIDRDNYKKIIKAFKKQYSEIESRTDNQKGILAFHRIFLIIGLALYKSLHDEFQNQEELIEKIHDILWRGPMKNMVRFLAFFVRRSRDPFQRYLQILGPNNEWFFPCPPWEKVSVEIQDGVGWHQKKCPYKDFFEKEGVVELTRAYCDMDKRIAELFPNHIELKRQYRLAKGDDRCDFLYFRK